MGEVLTYEHVEKMYQLLAEYSKKKKEIELLAHQYSLELREKLEKLKRDA